MAVEDEEDAPPPGPEEQPRQEQQRPPVARPAQRATVVAVAILDITGILVTVVAVAVVLGFSDEADRTWWWGGIGLAFLLAVFTTVLLIRIWVQRRSFLKASLRLAQDLEDLTKPGGPPMDPRALGNLRELARTRRDAALASGDLAIADRLAVVLARFP